MATNAAWGTAAPVADVAAALAADVALDRTEAAELLAEPVAEPRTLLADEIALDAEELAEPPAPRTEV